MKVLGAERIPKSHAIAMASEAKKSVDLYNSELEKAKNELAKASGECDKANQSALGASKRLDDDTKRLNTAADSLKAEDNNVAIAAQKKANPDFRDLDSRSWAYWVMKQSRLRQLSSNHNNAIKSRAAAEQTLKKVQANIEKDKKDLENAKENCSRLDAVFGQKKDALNSIQEKLNSAKKKLAEAQNSIENRMSEIDVDALDFKKKPGEFNVDKDSEAKQTAQSLADKIVKGMLSLLPNNGDVPKFFGPLVAPEPGKSLYVVGPDSRLFTFPSIWQAPGAEPIKGTPPVPGTIVAVEVCLDFYQLSEQPSALVLNGDDLQRCKRRPCGRIVMRSRRLATEMGKIGPVTNFEASSSTVDSSPGTSVPLIFDKGGNNGYFAIAYTVRPILAGPPNMPPFALDFVSPLYAYDSNWLNTAESKNKNIFVVAYPEKLANGAVINNFQSLLDLKFERREPSRDDLERGVFRVPYMP